MPTGSSRRVSFTVNDGLFNSTPAYACVQLIEQNDQPVLTLGPNGTVDVMLTYTEGQSEPLYLARDLNIEGEAGEALAMDSSLVGRHILYSTGTHVHVDTSQNACSIVLQIATLATIWQ